MISRFTYNALFKANIFQFATSSQIAAKTFAKFQKKFSENSGDFKSKMQQYQKAQAQNIKPTTQKAYVHPYDSPHHPINFSPNKIDELYSDAIGPEQVSPHYENFLMSRKIAVSFWVGSAFMIWCSQTDDLQQIVRSLAAPWLVYFMSLYFWMEGKKSLIKPYLARFYARISAAETRNMIIYYEDNVQARIRRLMAIAKEQIDYKLIHNDYKSIRNESILNFLVNQQISLQNHINHRAVNILKQVEVLEDLNQRKIINKVVEDAAQSLQKAYSQNKAKIEADIFELALQGIEKGEMDYANDPILPYILENIKKSVQSFQTLTQEDQNKMISLTQQQFQSIKNSDVRARQEYIKNEPKLQGALRSNQTVTKILANWGKIR